MRIPWTESNYPLPRGLSPHDDDEEYSKLPLRAIRTELARTICLAHQSELGNPPTPGRKESVPATLRNKAANMRKKMLKSQASNEEPTLKIMRTVYVRNNSFHVITRGRSNGRHYLFSCLVWSLFFHLIGEVLFKNSGMTMSQAVRVASVEFQYTIGKSSAF